VVDHITELRNSISDEIEATRYASRVDTHKLNRLYGEAKSVTTSIFVRGTE
jgi:hypothetical protein